MENQKNLNLEEIKNIIIGDANGQWNHWNSNRLTMVGLNVLNNLQQCLEDCIKNNVEGDFVETGVWKGGCSILAHQTFKKYQQNRKVYCFDSFAGLPKPNIEKYPVDKGDNHHTIKELAVSLEEVKNNFQKFGDLDENVIFVKGWFEETLPKNEVEKICVLRLDGDMYESTILALDNLYPKLSVGGYCIIDDYIHHGARTAVEEYRQKHGIQQEILLADKTPGAYPVSYWKK
jgi:O-methyltransferase